jgi:hypothetical protein
LRDFGIAFVDVRQRAGGRPGKDVVFARHAVFEPLDDLCSTEDNERLIARDGIAFTVAPVAIHATENVTVNNLFARKRT